MAAGDQYRLKASELAAKAQAERSARLRAEYAIMARSYLRLAAQADRNAIPMEDVYYETPVHPDPPLQDGSDPGPQPPQPR